MATVVSSGDHAVEHSVTVIIFNFDVEEKRNSDDKGKGPDADHNYLGNFRVITRNPPVN